MRPNTPANGPLRCGELARLAGISADTVRYYERLRLLPAAPRSASGYRLFPRETVVRVQLIRGALSIGFSVSELADILRERDRGGVPCRRVQRVASEKLAALDARIRALQTLRRELRTTLAAWESLLTKTARNKQARLLETFGATHPKSPARNSRFGALARGNHKRERQK